ncbi:MAG: WGR domain-containing protein [Rhodobacteraceae bacterium]|jgi:predicted DNA-binding WGR domain protein|nr:WGR domain-containing protein [Paracoccaceae bacterium]
MLTLILHRGARGRPLPARSFYRVEVADNLFGEYSVLREWGQAGRRGRQSLSWFSNLRDAVLAADSCHRRAQARGYHLTERRLAQR